MCRVLLKRLPTSKNQRGFKKWNRNQQETDNQPKQKNGQKDTNE